MKNEKCNAIPIAIGITLLIACGQGSMFTFGILMSDIISDTGFSMPAVLLLATFSTGGTFVGNLFVGTVMSKLSSKWTLFLGCILIPVHFTIYSVSTQLWMLYAAGALSGIATAFIMAPASVLLSNWFVAKRNTVISVAFGGMNIGGALFMLAAGRLVGQLGWRKVELINAAIVLVISLLIGLFVIREKPSDLGQKAYGYDQTPDVEDTAGSNGSGVSAKDAYRSPSFWILFAGFFIIISVGYCFTNLGPTYMTSLGMEMSTASSYASVYSMVAVAGAVVAGTIADKFGEKAYLIYGGLLAVLGSLLLTSGNISIAIMIPAVLCLGLAEPISNSSAALLTSSCFGMKEYYKIVGFMQGALSFGAAVMVPVVGAIAEAVGMGLALKAAAGFYRSRRGAPASRTKYGANEKT